MSTLGQILLAYVAADALSGLYHLLTDYGCNIKSQVAQFENHHQRPGSMTFDLEPVAGALPLAAAAWWWASPFLWALAGFVAVVQLPHYFCHHPEYAPAIVRLLQRLRLIITPAHHRGHHRPPFDKNFCIFTGWNDLWLNAVLWLVRFLWRHLR